MRGVAPGDRPIVVSGVVMLPPAAYWRLAARAERSGRTVTEEISAALVQLTAEEGDPDDDELYRLWKRGLADREIARELGWTNERVADLRRRRGMPANRKQRRA